MNSSRSSKTRSSKGRQKIEIKRIEKDDARRVAFSKRRAGLFNKANELSVLCGAEVAVVAFSCSGKPYSYGHPSVEAVVQRFTSGSGGGCSPVAHELARLEEALQVQGRRKRGLQEAIAALLGDGSAPLGDGAFDDWLLAGLQRVRADVSERLQRLAMEEQVMASSSQTDMDAAAAAAGGGSEGSGIGGGGLFAGFGHDMMQPPNASNDSAQDLLFFGQGSCNEDCFF